MRSLGLADCLGHVARAGETRRSDETCSRRREPTCGAHHACSVAGATAASGWRPRRTSPFGQPADDAEEERNEEDADRRREQHSGEHAGADRVAARRARAARQHQRQHAEDERERRHENRAQSLARRFDRRLSNAHAVRAQLVRELHDQDRVLRRETDDRDQSDLEIDVVRLAADPDAEQRAEHAERHAEQHGERHRPTLVLRGEHEEDEHETQREHERRVAARRALLVRLPGVRNAEARRRELGRDQVVDLVQQLARCCARAWACP